MDEVAQKQALDQIVNNLTILRKNRSVDLVTIAKIEAGTKLAPEAINQVLHGSSDKLQDYQLVRDFIECQLLKLGDVN